MLVNRRHKIALYTPFKCYATSLHYYFMRSGYWLICIGPHPHSDLVDTHTNLLANQWKEQEFRLWLPVRNPFDRVVSMWRYACQPQFSGPHSFDEFVEKRISEPHLGPVTELYPYTEVIRVEELPGALIERGFNFGRFPHYNRSPKHPYTMTEALRERIRQVHASDFSAGGYDPTGLRSTISEYRSAARVAS